MKHLALSIILCTVLSSCGNDTENQITDDCIAIFEALKTGDQNSFYMNFLDEHTYNEAWDTNKIQYIPKNDQTEIFNEYHELLKDVTRGRTTTLTPTHLLHIASTRRNIIVIYFKDERGQYYEFYGLTYAKHDNQLYYSIAADNIKKIKLEMMQERLEKSEEKIKKYKDENPSAQASVELIHLE